VTIGVEEIHWLFTFLIRLIRFEILKYSETL